MASKTTSEKYKRFEVVQAAQNHEQSHYWNRFTAFATLHAGLYVLATSSNLGDGKSIGAMIVAALGLLLAAVWVQVQWLSLQYVDRWKATYHNELRNLKFDLPTKKPLNSRASSTDLALIVPFAVLLVWGVVTVITVLSYSN